MQKIRYIPIGIDCSIAHYLRSRNLRHEAYPFDWNVTPLRSSIQLLQNDFQDFMEIGNLEFLPPTNRLLFDENGIDLQISKEIVTPVICRRYGILFPHDFSASGREDFFEVKRKYQRRIQRIRKALNNPESIRFVFHNGRINSWQVEQYAMAGLDFEETTAEDLSQLTSEVKGKEWKFISCDELKGHNISFMNNQFIERIYRSVRRRVRRAFGPKKFSENGPKLKSSLNTAKLAGISIKADGRFGNNLTQVANAIILAEVGRFKSIRLPDFSFLSLKGQVAIGGLTFTPFNHPHDTNQYFLEGSFYSSPESDFGVLSQGARRRVIRNYIKPLLNLPKPIYSNEKQIVIHLRSGDIFDEKPSPGYTQPPLSYYKRILSLGIQNSEIETVLMVYEDEKNPCVSELIEYLSDIDIQFKLQSGSLEDDMAYLLGAQQAVFGCGTFGTAVCHLSDNLKNVDVFVDGCGDQYKGFTHFDRIRCWKAKENTYIQKNRWANTPKQRKLMLSHSENAIELVRESKHFGLAKTSSSAR